MTVGDLRKALEGHKDENTIRIDGCAFAEHQLLEVDDDPFWAEGNITCLIVDEGI